MIVKKHIRSFAVVNPPTVSLGRPDPRAAGLLRVAEHSVARALERPASGFSACRECCVSICLVDGCGGGLLVAFGYKFTELRIVFTRIDARPARTPPPLSRRETPIYE